MACCLFQFALLLWLACFAMCYVAPIGGISSYVSFLCFFVTDHMFNQSKVTKTSAKGQGTAPKVRQRPKSSTSGAVGEISQGQPKTKVLPVTGSGLNFPRSSKDQSPPRQRQWVKFPKVRQRPKTSTSVTLVENSPNVSQIQKSSTLGAMDSVPRSAKDQCPS